jgi:cation:H+ antiporter
MIKGGDFFVDEATWFARLTGLPEVLIGATIVSLATTSPETTVSILATLQNYPSVAIGNAIGSIICNTGLILGLYHLIRPNRIDSRIFKYKGLMMLGYICFFWLSARKGYIDHLSGLGLLLLLIVYIIFNLAIVKYKRSKKRKVRIPSKYSKKEASKHFLLFVFGVGLILIGANLLVTYGVKIANSWGVPEAVISLSMIALGTSLPELTTAITALVKGHDELALGNVLGANILNIAMVIGLSASIRPLIIQPNIFLIDIPVALVLGSILVVPTIITKRINRIQAFLLLSGYAAYILALFLFIKY